MQSEIQGHYFWHTWLVCVPATVEHEEVHAFPSWLVASRNNVQFINLVFMDLSTTFALFWNNKLQRDEVTKLIIEYVENLCKIFLNWDQMSKYISYTCQKESCENPKVGSNIWFNWQSSCRQKKRIYPFNQCLFYYSAADVWVCMSYLSYLSGETDTTHVGQIKNRGYCLLLQRFHVAVVFTLLSRLQRLLDFMLWVNCFYI